MVCKEREVDCNPSNEGRHMSFIAAVGTAEISRDASEMEGPGAGSPMASFLGNGDYARLAEAL